MNLAISNIAWSINNDEVVLGLLKKHGFKGVELAPTKYSSDLSWAKEDWLDLKKRIEDSGVRAMAFQALLYGRNDLKIFEGELLRSEMLEYLGEVMKIAQIFGVKNLVFGSPKNRYIGENLSYDEAYDMAKDFFRKMGEQALKYDTCICIEANPIDYNCNFLTETEQVVKFVRDINSDGVRLHIDTGTIAINNENPVDLINSNNDILGHFHISEPFLNHVNEKASLDHAKIAQALKDVNYKGWVSIEMRGQENEVEAIKESLKFVSSIYNE